MAKNIQTHIDKIHSECDKIEGNIEPKSVRAYGDPIVQFHD